jgi:hypothetical protein
MGLTETTYIKSLIKTRDGDFLILLFLLILWTMTHTVPTVLKRRLEMYSYLKSPSIVIKFSLDSRRQSRLASRMD